jgi:hypothetical protein
VNIPAEIRAILQIPNDPAAFVLAMFRTFFSPLRTVHNRVVQRTGITVVEIADADPRAPGKQRARIAMRDSGNDPGKLAARVAILVVERGKGALYVDEARRWLAGKPVGTSKSLDDDQIEPVQTIDPAIVGGARTFDPVTLTLIVGVAVPLLVAILPTVLPMVIEWGKSAFAAITNTPNGPVERPATPPAERQFGVAAITGPLSDVVGVLTGGDGDGDPSNDTQNVLIVVGIAAAIIYFATRK